MLIICNALPEISQTKAMDNTFKEAEAIATQHIVELQEKIGMALLLTKNQEASFDWVFFYQSKEYMETENLSSMLAGNAPTEEITIPAIIPQYIKWPIKKK